MIHSEEVYRIGQFNRTHGVKGELQFSYTDDIFDRVQADYILCMMDGILVPFYLESYRIRSASSALLKLEDIDSQEKASRFVNVEVYFPKKLAADVPPEELTWDYFVGFTVEEVTHGWLGVIQEVDQSTLNVLFVVHNQNQELLIPACEEFIREIDPDKQVIRLELPEGMVTMNL